MKILHLAPLWYPVAVDAAGGRETVLAGLIQAQQQQGCSVSVVAAGDSRVAGRLVAAVEKNLVAQMAAGQASDYAYYMAHALALVAESATQYDIVHSHVFSAGFALSAWPGMRHRVLHTLHIPIYEDMAWFVRQHPDYWYTTVSGWQARLLEQAGAEHCFVVPNGIAVEQFQFGAQGSSELAFLGRIEESKGPDLAVAVARSLGCPLTLAGPIINRAFFDQRIAPFLDNQIRYLGTVDHQQRNELLSRAGCALLPFRGNEAFGMVSIEAMACGTPVVALPNGALPEVVEPGLTGYLAADEAGLAAAVGRARQLDRTRIRARVAERFSLATVARQYQEIYARMRAAP